MKRKVIASELWDIALNVWNTGAHELSRIPEYVNMDSFISLVNILAECRGRILTAGVGTSGAAAKKIAHSLCCIERPAFFLDPGDAVHGGLGAAQPGDAAILISKGGGTSELISLIPALKKKDVRIIGVTENPDSVLGMESDLCLKIKVEKEADKFNMLATTSTMAVVAVFDALCITLIEYTGYTKEQFAVIHPGGAVGKRLLKGDNSDV